MARRTLLYLLLGLLLSLVGGALSVTQAPGGMSECSVSTAVLTSDGTSSPSPDTGPTCHDSTHGSTPLFVIGGALTAIGAWAFLVGTIAHAIGVAGHGERRAAARARDRVDAPTDLPPSGVATP